jgi:hypothetical protein
MHECAPRLRARARSHTHTARKHIRTHCTRTCSVLLQQTCADARARAQVRHVLSHTSGLQHAIPTDINMSRLCDFDHMVSTLVSTDEYPEHPWVSTQYLLPRATSGYR